jgi:acetoin utilization deacetylase AcuC-like enzyme
MVAEAHSYSPSAAKPLQVMASWARLGVPLEVLAPEPASVNELARAHERRFVEEVLSGRSPNGFGNHSLEVAASLRWTSGAMRSAARHAWRHGGFAVAPCSGFHHAGWRTAAGFCTFNGLMVAAMALHAEGARRVGIVDCDMHFGDGTEELLDTLGARGQVRHFTAGARYSRPSHARAFFAALPEILAGFADCEVVLYQAGADPHVDDPLGGWLTTAQLRARDELVFSTLAGLGVPVAWNLAGGYQRDADGGISKVLEVHDNTLLACARVRASARERERPAPSASRA